MWRSGIDLLRRAAVLVVLLASRSALADQADADVLERRTTTAIVVGGALELAPFAIGGTMVANASDATVRRAGVYVSSAGLTLAPLLAHGMMSEWARGVPFAAVPFACGVGLAVLMQQPQGDVLSEQGTATTRVPFWALASLSLAASSFGLFDAALAPSRARSRTHALYLIPSRVPAGALINVGGTF